MNKKILHLSKKYHQIIDTISELILNNKFDKEKRYFFFQDEYTVCGFKWKRNESIKQALFLKIKNKMIQLIYPILNQILVFLI